MGVVKRQGIKQSIVTYFGVALGMANVLFFYPAWLERDEIGILTYVRETAAMLSLFAFLGSAELVVRFFPYFRNEEKKHHGFLFWLFAILGTGCLLLALLFLIFRQDIIEFYAAKGDPLYLRFVFFMLPFTVLIAFSNLLIFYASNFHRIVVPSIFSELFPKIGLPLLAFAYFSGAIPFHLIFWGMLMVQALVFLGVAGYLIHLGQFHLRPDFKFLKKPLLREMLHYCGFGFLGSLGSRFSSEFVSIFMVGTLSTLTNSGIFTIAYFICTVIDVPRKAISRITAPLLADKWKEGKLAEIEDIYHKSSLNQLIIGLWLFLGIWICLDELYQIMPNGEKYMAGKYVVFLLGLARVVDMATGVNTEIISFSKHYRYNFYFILFMAIVHVAANLVLIPKYELIGAALATFVSILFFNVLKFIVLKWKMNMQPFTWQTLAVLLTGGLAYGAVVLIPATGFVLMDILLKGMALTLVFGSSVFLFRLSPDLRLLAENALVKGRRFLGRRRP